MTVNTLGSHEPVRSSRTVAEWLWPFLPMAIAAFFLSSLLYYHTHYASMAVRTPLQVLVAEVYRIFGLAPSFLFFLLVGTWSSIWLYTGQLERPWSRLGRLSAMAVLLGVFLNLGDGGVAPAVQKGALGAWIAGQLVGVLPYFLCLVFVLLATIASMLLATDFFFSEGFDRLLRSRQAVLADEAGVESAVTDHLRTLGALPKPAARESAPAPSPAPAASVRAAGAPPQSAVATEAEPEVPAPDEPAPLPESATEREVDLAPDDGRRSSYFDRRRERLERARARAAEAEAESEEQTPAAAADATDTWLPAPESQEIDNAESSLDAAMPSASAPTNAAAAAADLELAALLGELEADEDDAAAEGSAGAQVADEEDADEEDAPDAEDAGALNFVAVAAGHDEPTADDGDADDGEADDVEADVLDLVDGDEQTSDVDEDEGEPDAPAAVAEPVAGERAVPIPRPETPPAFVVHEPPMSRPAPAPTPAPAPAPTPAPGRQGNLFQGSDEGLVQEAIEVVTGAGRATAGLLQRKLRIDYQEALGLLAELAARGVIALEGDATHGRVLS